MRNKVLIYHGGNCSDGFGAKWSFYQKFKEDMIYHAMTHNDDLPDFITSETELYMADIALSEEKMLYLKSTAKSFICLDHHVSAMERLSKLDFCTFDMNRSGSMMAWEFCFPEEPVAPIIKYVQDRDLWNWKLLESRFVLNALDLVGHDLNEWSKFNENLKTDTGFHSIVEIGKSLQAYIEIEISKCLQTKHFLTIKGEQIPAVNSSNFRSEIGDALCKDHEYSVVYFYSPKGWYFSLRSQKESGVDVSKIAQNFHNGGGHKNASGFTIASLDELK